MGTRRWACRRALTPLLLATALSAAGAQEAAFEMREVSVFEDFHAAPGDQPPPWELTQGHAARSADGPAEEVKAYPKLVSKRPLYGTLTFSRSQIYPYSQATYHFVLDESGKTPPDKDPVEEDEDPLAVLTAVPIGPNTAYDLLYLDLNGDLDLTNDPVLRRMKDPPARYFLPGEPHKYRPVHIFDYLDLTVDCGPELGARPLRLIPKLNLTRSHSAYISGGVDWGLQFVPELARKGKIRVGEEETTAYLAQSGTVTGRFDDPFTSLYLTPRETLDLPHRYRAEWLGMTREQDGQLYRFSATAAGDKLFVEPYRGPMGLFEADAGGRDIDPEKLGVGGLMVSKEGAAVILVKAGARLSDRPPRQHRLPVGDYRPMR
ncbi:MAG: hypothetical protein ACYTG0_24215, partial [Planctomycetota bacterium]